MNQFLSIALKTHFESLKVSGKGENYWQCYQAFFNYCDIYGDLYTNFQRERIKMYWQGQFREEVLLEDLRINCMT